MVHIHIPEPSVQGGKPPRQPDDLFGCPPDDPAPDEPEAHNPKAQLFDEGLAIVAKLAGKSLKASRPLLGTFRKQANGDDDRLLALLRAADKNPPAHLESWVVGCLRTPKLVVNNVPENPNDLWGIDAFCRGAPGVTATEGDDQAYGKWVLDGKWMLDVAAKKVATAARFAGARSVDWGLLVEWLRAGLKMDQDIIPIITRLTGAFEQPATMLRVFDRTIREQRAA